MVNVVCTDKFLLFNSWLYLVENLEVLVVQLRADAEKHFNQEHNIHSSGGWFGYLVVVLRCIPCKQFVNFSTEVGKQLLYLTSFLIL